MPEIEALADIDPDDFWYSCSTRERKDMIDIVVQECSENKELQDVFIKSVLDSFPSHKSLLESQVLKTRSYDYSEFISALDKLGRAYYQLPNEDIEKIKDFAKRF